MQDEPQKIEYSARVVQPLLILIAATCLAQFCLCASTVAAEKDSKDQPLQAIKNQKGTNLSLIKNHDPEAEFKTFKLLPGFGVNLFAAEPMLANPIHMTWDARGRLWVACSWSYPQLRPGETPNDKIIILEDIDGDGKADKSTVFADKLYIPTGLALSNGGVYVAQAPDVLYLKDTDGDDRADVRRVILTGFGIEDSHHSISAWRRGPGGWIYFQEGIFLHSQVETQYGIVRLTDGGVWQFNPLTQKLQVFADCRVGNPWGHMFDRWGQSIFIDNPRVYFLAPVTANSRAKLGFNPLISTEKQCGGDIVSGRNFPPNMLGQIVTNRFKSQSVIRYSLQDAGSGLAATLQEPLIKATHPNFRPVDCKMGPDGALYICDWYNPIINHARHDFRDPRRDFGHGRIWRVRYKDRPLVERPKLVGLPLEKLLDQLKAPEAWTRHQVKLLLGEMGPKKVATAVLKWVDGLDSKGADYDHHLLEALWSLQNVNVVSEPLLKKVLAAKTGEARAAAVRVIRYWHPKLSDPLALLDKAAQDSFPRVRLEAVLSLSFIPDARAMPIALRVLDQPRDRFLDHALTLSIDGLSPYWRTALKEGKLEFFDQRHKDFALAASSINLQKQLQNLLKGRGIANSPQINNLLSKVEVGGTAKDVTYLLDVVTRETRPDEALTLRIMSVLAKAVRQRNVRPSGKVVKRLGRLLKSDNPQTIRSAALDLVGALKFGQATRQLQTIVAGTDESMAIRRDAARALGQLGGARVKNRLSKLLADSRPIEERYLGLIGMAAMDLKAAAELVPELFSQDPGKADPVPVVQLMINREGGADLLANALSDTKPHARVVAAVTGHFRDTGQLHQGLLKAFGLDKPSPLADQLLTEDAKKLAAELMSNGDAERGEKIYRRMSLGCMVCHGIGGAGPNLGPDLAAIGSATQPDYIVDAILRPTKSVAQQFESVQIITRDGRIVTGTLKFRSAAEIVVRSAAARGSELTVPRSHIKSIKTTPSLMPVGLANGLKSRQEFLDLTKFISQLGRPGQYEPTVAPIVRRWRVLPTDRPVSKLDPKTYVNDALWLPTYSMADGTLPVTEFGESVTLLVRGHIDVTRSGKVRLKINSSKGLSMWVDDKAVNLGEDMTLKPGRRSITFVIDTKQRGAEGLHVEIAPADKALRYKILGGP